MFNAEKPVCWRKVNLLLEALAIGPQSRGTASSLPHQFRTKERLASTAFPLSSLLDQIRKIHVHPVCCRCYQAVFPHLRHYFLPFIGMKIFGVVREVFPKVLILDEPVDTGSAFMTRGHM